MIQLAMYLIHQEIKRRRLTSTMLFQVHDELVFSVPEEEVKTLIEIAVRHLTTAVELVVPTPVEVQIGPSWGELESYEKWQDGSAVGRQLVTA
jgi:DNA polymerase-1